MIRLPPQSARCAVPIPRSGAHGGDLLPSEESASLLLWAWPSLLGWPQTINWLFSPVTGKNPHPGDLWGLDSQGDLLIVETKLDRNGTTQDPFKNFVVYGRGPASQKHWRADQLRRRWEKLMVAEEAFLLKQARLLNPEPLLGLHRGVLPYSRHRDATWRWQKLYRDHIAPRFQSGAYRRAVERGLGMRTLRRDPPPAFVGLIATVRPEQPRLSAKGTTALRALEKRVGPDRVCLRTLRVVSAGADRVRVDCLTEPMPRRLDDRTRGRGVENPPELTEEDERLLDLAWDKVRREAAEKVKDEGK